MDDDPSCRHLMIRISRDTILAAGDTRLILEGPRVLPRRGAVARGTDTGLGISPLD
jgi:hypothetical protein